MTTKIVRRKLPVKVLYQLGKRFSAEANKHITATDQKRFNYIETLKTRMRDG